MSDDAWKSYLDEDEKILWQGRPNGDFSLELKSLPLVGFSTFFTGFAVFWMVMASRAGGAFWMFGLIHFTIGLLMLLRALAGDTFRRRHTYYTLTDKRAFIATDMPITGRRLKSYNIDAQSVLDLRPGPLSSIYFTSEERRNWGFQNGFSNSRHYTAHIGFEKIEDGDHVMRLMRQIQSGKSLTGTSS